MLSGMCVLEMITQEKPYSECVRTEQIIYKVWNNEPPEALERIKDPEVLEFIMQCLHAEKEKRPTARQLLNSPFLQNLENKKNNESVRIQPAKKRPPEKKKTSSLSKHI